MHGSEKRLKWEIEYTIAHWHAFPMTPKREIFEEVLEEMEIATMAAIRGITTQTHFPPKPFSFFFNSEFTITLLLFLLFRYKRNESTRWIASQRVLFSGAESSEKKIGETGRASWPVYYKKLTTVQIVIRSSETRVVLFENILYMEEAVVWIITNEK